MSNVTVEAMNLLVQDLSKLEEEKEVIEASLKLKNKAIIALEIKITEYMKDLKMEKYTSPFGELKINQTWRISLPKDELKKLELFEYLKSIGQFEARATVHSGSLNSLYMKNWKEAQERGEGMTYSMPGVDAPTLYEIVKLKILSIYMQPTAK